MNTTATAAASGASAGAGLAGDVGFAAKLLAAPALKGGGIIPSAAGGFLVGGNALAGGGSLAILHPHEMVLPANISEGVQNAIGRGEGGGGTTNANLTYAPTINGPGAFATRAQAETFFRQHGDIMMGQARNLIRNGARL